MRQVFIVGGLILATAGCTMRPFATGPAMPIENPARCGAHPDYVYDQVVDVVDNYFEIEREERPRLVGDVITPGRIDTLPTVGSTLLEPWRKDSANAYQRLESTLQSMRRRALVQVIPTAEGTLIDVAVYKELEDVIRPEFAPTAAATFRHDESLIRYSEPVGGQPAPLGWIPQGRDCALEQRMLAQIMRRLKGPPPSPFHFPFGP